MKKVHLMRQALVLVLLLLFLAVPALAARPKYVFYFIGDGLGAAQRQLGQFFLQEQSGNKAAKLLINNFEVAGLNTTYCADSLITDSAAAGTALASGVKTNKGVIGKNVNGNNVKTLVEAARDAGMKTGLITTTRLTHATPAAFAAHNASRRNENEIAEDFLNAGVDFLAGGGARHFIPQSMKIEKGDAMGNTIKSKRKDEKDLVQAFEKKGYRAFVGMAGAKAFSATDFSKVDRAFSVFTYSHTPYEIERRSRYPDMPSLAAVTRAGMEVLKKGDKGFFLMVEGGRIDHACHSNDATGAVYDILAFDNAVKVAHDFLKAHQDETLIVVVGDHETGGLGLGMDGMGYKLNIAALTHAKVSVEDTLTFGSGQYRGDRAAYTAMLAEDFGLGNLTEAETIRLTTAFDTADTGRTVGYYKANPTAWVAAHLLSERANINWTATIHTATMIPMSATGQEALQFGGYKDNTEIATAMAKVMGFKL